MFGKDKIKADSKELHSLQEKKKKIDNHFYDLMDKYNCTGWPGYYSGKVEHLEDRFRDCKDNPNVDEMISICREQEKAAEDIKTFIETEYARDVFNKYVAVKPQLVRNKTGETVSWDKAFGENFDELDANKKNALVGLIEGQSKYRLA